MFTLLRMADVTAEAHNTWEKILTKFFRLQCSHTMNELKCKYSYISENVASCHICTKATCHLLQEEFSCVTYVQKQPIPLAINCKRNLVMSYMYKSHLPSTARGIWLCHICTKATNTGMKVVIR